MESRFGRLPLLAGALSSESNFSKPLDKATSAELRGIALQEPCSALHHASSYLQLPWITEVRLQLCRSCS